MGDLLFGNSKISSKGPPQYLKTRRKTRKTKSNTMATFSVVNDITKPMDTSNWIKVQAKKSNMNHHSKEKLESMRSAMKQTQLTVTIRISPDAADDYSAAETHIATIKEISKQDSNLVVLDYKGNSHVNVHKPFSEEKYKENFQPREKKLPNGMIQVSVAHHILSNVTNFNKALLLPFLKKNRVYIHFNQKEGLEHFAAIGVFFGPHPELSWRNDIVEKIEKTMRADITEDECKAIDTQLQNPKIVISMVPQQISNLKYNQTKSVALEIRVPADHEGTYLNILDRLNERASTLPEGEVDITLDDGMGIFFPYYAKRSRPNLFDSLMKKQNAEMNAVSAIPIFGMTDEAMDTEITSNSGTKKTTYQWITGHDNVIKMERTASAKEVGKYILIVDRHSKEEVEDFIDNLLEQIPEQGDNIGPFKKPQRGGNAFQKKRVNNINNYLNKLEKRISADISMLDDETLSATPPHRPKRMTISYAQAAKRLSFDNGKEKKDENHNNAETTATSMSTLTQSSLDEALQKIRIDTENSIRSLREEMKNDVSSMEDRIATSVINALKAAPPVVQMETESDANSAQSSAQESTMTVQTLMDKFDSLTQMVKLLSEKVIEIAEKQESSQKRTRSLGTPPKFDLPPALDDQQQTRSPPNKLQRAQNLTPTKSPPNGIPNNGTREGQK